ncbi:4857_t:CDS:2 [Dentiscutata erythropus]|uniref:4857_t:CDS:1 n=1 Tax=Dentiscutata erythropus TaxID=1348616 RepID=A0A9N9JR80_9GLOM|nr:4857_t:CDS:2 [Dentiscutata erythropus]
MDEPDENEHDMASIEHDENEVLLPEKMAEEIFNKISLVGSDEFFENELNGINFKSNIVLDGFKDEDDTPQEIAKKIANLISDSDGYYYIYFNYYSSKKNNDLYTFQYRCSQCRSLAKKPRKHQDLECQRDRESIERFDCSGTLRISINMIDNHASIYLKHEILHKRPKRNRVTEEIKNEIKANLHLMPSDIYRRLEHNYPEITQKQIHAWWTTFIKKKFILLYLGMDQLICMYTDKDLAQISAIRKVWPNIKIQVCYWHFKKALKKRLADNTLPQRIIYSSYDAHSTFSFIDIEFYPELPENRSKARNNFMFCPKNLRPRIISMMEHHMHLHSLIPNSEGTFITQEEIWKYCTKEMYEFCVTNNLKHLWSYMWQNWYRGELWPLWARSSISDRIYLVIYILIAQLTPHHQQQYYKYYSGREMPSWRKEFKKEFKKEWGILTKKKLNNTYLTNVENWFCNCTRFLLNRFFLCKHLIQLSSFIANPSFFRNVQRERYISIYNFTTQETSSIRRPLLSVTNNLSTMSSNYASNNSLADVTAVTDNDNSDQLFENYESILQDALLIVQEQRKANNIKWAQAVEKSFEGISTMVTDIKKYKRRITNPRTWKDHNKYTMFL